MQQLKSCLYPNVFNSALSKHDCVLLCVCNNLAEGPQEFTKEPQTRVPGYVRAALKSVTLKAHNFLSIQYRVCTTQSHT